MILKLQSHDIEPLCDRAGEFHRVLGMPGQFSTASFCSQWRKLMEAQIGHVWAQTLDGHLAQSIGLVVHDDIFTGEATAAVLFWYRDLERPGNMGVKLFLEMLAWCKENNVKWLIYSARLGYQFKKVQEFLLCVGFVPAEVGFVMKL